jgi:cell volume regulation protein A
VFIAGIVLGDAPAPYKREIERFHAALASLGEIVAFVVLGLAIDLGTLVHTNVWVPGIIIGVALAVAIRPVLVGLCLLPARLQQNERRFVLFAGLKGAVPILLGTLILTAHTPDAERLFGIIVVVVIFSVVVQGSLVPVVAQHLHLSMRTIEPEPWALGIRLRDEPAGVHRFTVAAGSRADGLTVQTLEQQIGDTRISFLSRDSRLISINEDTRLQANDQVLVVADPRDDVQQLFDKTGAPTPDQHSA